MIRRGRDQIPWRVVIWRHKKSSPGSEGPGPLMRRGTPIKNGFPQTASAVFRVGEGRGYGKLIKGVSWLGGLEVGKTA